MEIGPSTTSIELTPIAVTGIAEFDYFFTIVFVFGALAYYCSVMVRILRRSSP